MEEEKDVQYKDLLGLHVDIMNLIIDFCKKNNVNADEVRFLADNFQVSVDEGIWHPTTDSALQFFKGDECVLESL